MYAGVNLCSLKSRNNCIMRRKIVDIYKALRHFNVTAGEVRDIAEGYRYWINNPFESRPPYNTVYFCPLDNKLYSMPYSKRHLEKLFIGIEIDGVVYLDHYINNVRQDQLETGLKTIEARLSEKFNDINQFKLRMPTRDEAKILGEKAEGDMSLTAAICNKYCDVWITPNPDHPERTFATVQEHSARPHQPSEDTQAVLYLVTCPDDKQIFYGKVDKYGTPTKDTMSIYRQLYERLY